MQFPYKFSGITTAIVLSLSVGVGSAGVATAQDAYQPKFTSDGKLQLPEGEVWREWPTIGTPLTPNALNAGSAPFPEFHIVYIDPASFRHWKETGTFREGTVIAKELTLVRAPDGANPDGSTNEVSGVGYFMGDYSGFEITIKSKALYPDEPGNWAYYTFGHHALPYAPTAAKQPAEACNACGAACVQAELTRAPDVREE
jgi:hypothetical protein